MSNFNWQEIKCVLVIKLRHHGDVLLTSPVINQIKQHQPSTEIDALVYEETAGMLRDLPSLNNLYLIKRGKRDQGLRDKYKTESSLVKQLKVRQYDLVIHLTESWRGAILCRLLKPKYSVVAKYPHRKGQQTRLWKSSFTHHYPLPSRIRHTVDKHVDALRHLGMHPEKPSDLKLELAVNNNDREYVDRLIIQNNLQAGDYILFHPTSRWLFKCWNESYAAQLIDQLIELGHPVVITSGPAESERAMVSRILGQCQQSPVDLSGQTTLKQLGGLISSSRLFVGVDSVPMHIAAAFQKPTVVLFGPSGDKEWGPWQTPCRVLVSDAPCRPCGMDGCAGSKRSDCIQSISTQHVLQSIQDLLQDRYTAKTITVESAVLPAVNSF